MNVIPRERLDAPRSARLSRRQFLRGLGVTLALPSLESIGPRCLAGQELGRTAEFAQAATGAPLRMAAIYFPNGAIPSSWWPNQEGGDFELSRTLRSLDRVKHRLQILGGLEHINATPGPDGAGDHARASGTFLTGVRVKKTSGSDIRAGISVDQLIAQSVGHLTRFSSLELTADSVHRTGNCEAGYSCAYVYNLSWRAPGTPVAPEPNPRLVFERLFGAGNHGERSESLTRRLELQKSVLDFVLDDARALQRQLSYSDQHKLDDYLVSVREVEQRIERAGRLGAAPDPDMTTPSGISARHSEYIQVMFELLLLAFQTDSTRVATFMLANEGNNRAFPEIDIAEGHHFLTHHQNDSDKVAKVQQIDAWYVAQFAKFLDRMEQTKDVDGNSLLHNSMILYGSGNADGNRHTHTNLPLVLAGDGGGTLTPGRFRKFNGVPMSNLLLSLADRMGVTGVERLGDSSGRIVTL